jgi:SHS2 domain-containing protein
VYRWVEHTAELELQVEAPTEEGVFAEAGEALATLLGEPEPGPAVRREVEVSGADRAALLAEWLNELVYLADEGFLTERAVALELSEVSGENENHSHRLRAEVEGRPGTPRSLVKAVTYHRLRLAQEGVGWHGRVVLDV